jgi:hypothetical protein
LVDQTIMLRNGSFDQTEEFYFAIFEDFIGSSSLCVK